MMRTAVAILALAAGTSTANAAPAIETDTTEARACLPLDGGTLVGTGGGLVALDAAGQPTATWTAADGLPGTRIDSIVRISDELWIGTETGAARVAIAGGKLTVERTAGDTSVRDILRVGSATYLATADGVRLVTARGTSKIGKLRDATALAAIGTTLYAGGPSGLYRLEGAKLVPVRGVSDIAALHADGDQLWIATADGLVLRERDKLRPIGGGDVRRVIALDGVITAAGFGDGLARVDRGHLRTLEGLPRELAMAQAFASGRDGAACAGGLAGVWTRAHTDAPWIRAAHRAGPPANDVSALAADGDTLYVGTFDHGLAVRERGAWKTITADIDTRINALFLDGAHRLWIATASGLHVLDLRDRGTAQRMTKQDGLPTRSVLAVAGTHDGRIVAGTSHGAVILGTGRPQRLGPKATEIGNVWAIAEDADHTLWLGTTTGLYRGKPDDDTSWTRFSLASGHLRDDWVTALVVRDSSIYAGTYHGGVARLDLGETIVATQLGDGWINPSGLAFDGTHLLAATMEGLRIFDGATWKTQPGLPGKDTTATARVDGKLVIATRRGLAIR